MKVKWARQGQGRCPWGLAPGHRLASLQLTESSFYRKKREKELSSERAQGTRRGTTRAIPTLCPSHSPCLRWQSTPSANYRRVGWGLPHPSRPAAAVARAPVWAPFCWGSWGEGSKEALSVWPLTALPRELQKKKKKKQKKHFTPSGAHDLIIEKKTSPRPKWLSRIQLYYPRAAIMSLGLRGPGCLSLGWKRTQHPLPPLHSL